MARNTDSAEKELLKTIEGDPSVIRKLPQQQGGETPVEVVSKMVQGFIAKLSPVRQSAQAGYLDLINKGLIFVVGLVFLWDGYIFVEGFSRLQNIPRFDVATDENLSMLLKGVQLPLKPFSYYSEVILGRNIFVPFEETHQVVEKAALPKINDMVSNLRVVGISWSEKDGERYVMVEDMKTKLTYYLQEGNTFLNLAIKKIFEDRIIISFGEEEIELR